MLAAPPPPPTTERAASPRPSAPRTTRRPRRARWPRATQGACDKLFVPCVGLVERAQSHRDCGRLAGRRAPVRLEPVTESAVGVAEGGDRVADTSGVVTGVDLNEAANCRLAAPKRQIRPI